MAAIGPENPVIEEEEPVCGSASFNGKLKLRIAAIFIILVTSLFGTLLPILLRRIRRIRVGEMFFSFVKYFGSGVIIATAFIHLLAPSWEALADPCLGEDSTWAAYPWTPAIAMGSVFAIFITELIAHRTGASYLKRRGLRAHDTHSAGANPSSHTTHGLHVSPAPGEDGGLIDPAKGQQSPSSDEETGHSHEEEMTENALAQIIGVAILEFGVIFHSLIIGLTLAVNEEFITLFIVLVFHQMFEGLGLGSRLSSLPLPSKFKWVPYAAACLYASITPLGLAIGLGVRETFNPESANALIVAGLLDALSAGVLLWAGLVECLAHDFVASREMAVEASNLKVTMSVGSVVLGAGLMALLGFWA